MLIATANGGGSKKLQPEGEHVGRCIWLIDLGMQDVEYQGEHKKLRRIWIEWELSCTKTVFRRSDGEVPFTIGKEYTLYLGERSNLRRDLEAWRGKGFDEAELESFDVSRLLGAPAMLTIIHRVSGAGRTYAEITSITRVPKGIKVPAQICPSLKFDIENGADDVFYRLPKFVQDKIKKADGWQAESAHDENNGQDEGSSVKDIAARPSLRQMMEKALAEQK